MRNLRDPDGTRPADGDMLMARTFGPYPMSEPRMPPRVLPSVLLRRVTLPKALRVFLRHDQRLFAQLARLIFNLIAQFYSAASGSPISSAAVVAYQPFGDSLRFNSARDPPALNAATFYAVGSYQCPRDDSNIRPTV